MGQNSGEVKPHASTLLVIAEINLLFTTWIYYMDLVKFPLGVKMQAAIY
jgi:hypothetical protein